VADTGTAVIHTDPDRPDAAIVWIDDVPQSYVDLGDPTNLSFEYVRQIGDVIDVALPPGPVRALHLGGGGLTLPRYVASTRPRSRQRVVERDADLVDLVRRVLPIDPRHRITITVDDASGWLARARGTYDLVVVDVFAEGRVPAELVGSSGFEHLSRVLTTGGIVVINIGDGHHLTFARSVLATAGDRFASVIALAEPSVWRGRRFGNLVVVASQRALPTPALTRRLAGGTWPARVVAGGDLARFVGDAAPRADDDPRRPPMVPTSAFDVLRPPRARR